ncbi:MAG: hypothetical protein MR215_03125 [Bacteroidales bacterium]|nr:hypothetical protein [Bacteroidales bacterium]
MKNFFRRVFTGRKGKNLRVFMLFLLLSVLIWHIEKLRQTYTVTTRLEIVCEDVPEGYITDPELRKDVTTTIEGNGFSLLKMYITDSRKIKVPITPLRRYAEGGNIWAIYVPRRLANQNTNLPEHLRIVDVLTDTVMIPLLTVVKKKLPVHPPDNVAIAPHRTLSAPRSVKPDSVVVVATSNILDTMTAVWTEPQQPMTIADTTVLTIPFVLPRTASADADHVVVEYDVEILTEKRISVPIVGTNLPAGYRCRIFPPSAKLTFSVGLSRFDDADANAFCVAASFRRIRPGNKDSRIRLELVSAPDFVKNVTMSPSFAEFILEKDK